MLFHRFGRLIRQISLVWLILYIVAGISSKAHGSTDPQTLDSPVTANIPQATAAPSSDTIAPTIPILVRPVDGAITADTTPELVWLHSVDENSNYVYYTVYLDGVATYLGVSDTGNAGSYNYVSTLEGSEIRLIPTIGLADGTHNWFVRAQDASGNYADSTRWSFVIDTVAPNIVVEQLGPYNNPVIFDGASFTIYGPTVVNLSLSSDPFISLRLTILDSSGNIIDSPSSTTDGTGHAYFATTLPVGSYLYQISATDSANLTTLLPTFTVVISLTQVVVPVPGVNPPPTVTIPPALSQLASTIYNYPATISQVVSRSRIAIVMIILIAIIISILLVIYYSRYNLSITYLNGRSRKELLLQHSYNGYTDRYRFGAGNHWQLSIPHLGFRSTLTITIDDQQYSLCLIRRASRYHLVLS